MAANSSYVGDDGGGGGSGRMESCSKRAETNRVGKSISFSTMVKPIHHTIDQARIPSFVIEFPHLRAFPS